MAVVNSMPCTLAGVSGVLLVVVSLFALARSALLYEPVRRWPFVGIGVGLVLLLVAANLQAVPA